MIDVDEVWREISETTGTALRAVTWYDQDGFETRMRDDVRSKYSNREDQRVVDQVVLNQLLSKDIENAFKCGPLTGTVHIFEDAWILVQADPEFRKQGLIVSIDRDDSMTMADLDASFSYVRERVEQL
jgi:hypothetical protein